MKITMGAVLAVTVIFTASAQLTARGVAPATHPASAEGIVPDVSLAHSSKSARAQVTKICHRYGYSDICLPGGSVPGKTAGGLRKAIFSPGVTPFVCAFETFVGSHGSGTPFTCQEIPLLMPLCPGEVGHSVIIHGTELDLRVTNPPGERIYLYNPSTGTSIQVGAITGSGGEYTKVLGQCSSIPLPFTGGAPIHS